MSQPLTFPGSHGKLDTSPKLNKEKRRHTMNTKDPRKVGGTYLNAYWRKAYKVLEITHGDHMQWTCQWDSGEITTHATRWDWKKDKIIS